MAQLILSDEIAARLRALAVKADQSLDDLLREMIRVYEEGGAATKRIDLSRLIAEAMEDDNIEKPAPREKRDAHYRSKYDDDPDYFT